MPIGRAGQVSRWWERYGTGALCLLVACLSCQEVISSHSRAVTGLGGPLAWELAGCLVLAGRRRQPLVVALTIITFEFLSGHDSFPFTMMCALYSVGARVKSVPVLVGCALLAAGVRSGGFVPFAHDIADGVLFTLRETMPLVLGYAVAARRDVTRLWQGRVRAQLAQAQLRTERAQMAERAQIAREIHDTVAHRVGNMTLFAGSLSLRLPEAGSQIGLIKGQGRAALAELRSLVKLLAHDGSSTDPQVEDHPLPHLLSQLVSAQRQLGNLVTYTFTGSSGGLSALHRHTVYRVVQETLTNAAKHAPSAHLDLSVTCSAREVSVTGRNPVPPEPPEVLPCLPDSGHGLAGLAERLQLLGGSLSARQNSSGTFTLTARIPVTPEASPGSPAVSAGSAPTRQDNS